MKSNNEFYEAAHLDATRQKIYSSRRTNQIYADVLIASCSYENWWYKDFVGMSCFVRLGFRNYIGGEFLYNVDVVHLTNTRILIGRSISPEDIIIL